MSAKEHLNKELFHGTGHVFDENEVVEARPNSFLKQDIAFATPNRELGEWYAGAAAAKQGKLFGPVYEVDPIDPKEDVSSAVNSKSLQKDFNAPREHLAFGPTSNIVASKKGFLPKKIVGWGINTAISGKNYPL